MWYVVNCESESNVVTLLRYHLHVIGLSPSNSTCTSLMNDLNWRVTQAIIQIRGDFLKNLAQMHKYFIRTYSVLPASTLAVFSVWNMTIKIKTLPSDIWCIHFHSSDFLLPKPIPSSERRVDPSSIVPTDYFAAFLGSIVVRHPQSTSVLIYFLKFGKRFLGRNGHFPPPSGSCGTWDPDGTICSLSYGRYVAVLSLKQIIR